MFLHMSWFRNPAITSFSVGRLVPSAVVPQIFPHLAQKTITSQSIYRWYMLISGVLSQGYPTFPFDHGSWKYAWFIPPRSLTAKAPEKLPFDPIGKDRLPMGHFSGSQMLNFSRVNS